MDTIREEDKYGNDGEQLGQVGRSIVGGVEKVTNFLSSAVDVSIAPYNIKLYFKMVLIIDSSLSYNYSSLSVTLIKILIQKYL